MGDSWTDSVASEATLYLKEANEVRFVGNG